jgi:AAA15 family ATPase/GTPase
VDELDSSLHPTLIAEVVRMFRDPVANPRDAQLICNLHDASLLGSAHPEPVLDRHEVWITEKRRTGESELYPLADASPRKDENLERGYLTGRYGGSPRISLGELTTEMERQWAEAG